MYKSQKTKKNKKSLKDLNKKRRESCIFPPGYQELPNPIMQ